MNTSNHSLRFILATACLVAVGPADAAEQSRAVPPVAESPATTPLPPDPLANTLPISPEATGPSAEGELARMLPARTDSPFDWQAGLEPLHNCGEPRWLSPCIPPPPCHPAYPPQPFDLIGVDGVPTRGPRYRGPCCPRTGTHDDSPFPCKHRLHDRAFDWFYRPK
jgi:hypothetical protein